MKLRTMKKGKKEEISEFKIVFKCYVICNTYKIVIT